MRLYMIYISAMKKVGVLALQGSFAEHGSVLEGLGQDFSFVRSLEGLEGLTHLILPGGESTTLTKLLKTYGMWDFIVQKIEAGTLKVFGTCAGAILCSEWGMGISVDRNAYGAQQSSFIDGLDSEMFPDLQGVFIRAPQIKKEKDSVTVLASYKKEDVLLEENNFLVASFHPELIEDTRVHEYFLQN